MEKIKKLLGKILYALGKVIDVSLGFIIRVLEFILEQSKMVSNALLGTLGIPALIMLVVLFFIGGPLVFFIFLGPLIVAFRPFFKWIFILAITPIIAKYSLDAISFIRYSLVEYLYDKSGYLVGGKSPRYSGLGDYAREYLRKEEEARRRKAEEKRRREARRQQEAQKEFERKFFGGGANWSGSGGNVNYDFGGSSFKKQYEEACDVLEVGYGADENEIKSAYRKMAKKYHPDINKAPDAKEKFQKINDANSFLTKENMIRYRDLD